MNATAEFRFYEELNDFLPPERQKREFVVSLDYRTSVKDLIESLGVPHVEVDLILVDGRSVGFDYLVNRARRISVYPVFESLDGSGRAANGCAQVGPFRCEIERLRLDCDRAPHDRQPPVTGGRNATSSPDARSMFPSINV